jgi:hypothetical protein
LASGAPPAKQDAIWRRSLSANQTGAAFNAMLDASIQRIYEASST